MSSSRHPWSQWLMALALTLTALALWFPFATGGAIFVGGVGAAAGALTGHRAAGRHLRAFVPAVAAPALLWALFLTEGWISRWSLPATVLSPETAAGLRDALLVGAISALGAFVAAFYCTRVPALRPVPAGLLVLAFAGLVAAHRGGAIHLPTALSDLAWIRGWHPGLLLAALGGLCALVACFVLYRPGRTRWPLLQLALVFLAVLLVLALVPELSIFHFSSEDPLGLSSQEQSQEQETRRTDPGGGRSRGQQSGTDPLGLGNGKGQETEAGQMLPFRDEYSRSNNQVPVAVVVLHDDVEPYGGLFYFRQAAFSAWNGRRLVRAFRRDTDQDIFRRFPAAGPAKVAPPPNSRSRHMVETTVSLLRDHSAPPVLTDGEQIEGIATADPALFRASYRARSLVRVGEFLDLIGQNAGNPEWTDAVWDLYLKTPGDPRYAQLAEEAASTLHPAYKDDPLAKAFSVAMWLQENTEYSIRSKHSSAKDPTASYLFGDRIGYCVHLAHAGVYLMRSLGLPARVAGGYAYQASDRAGGSTILLRAGDAHAWAEVYLDEAGWVPFDPAPPSLDPPMPQHDLDLQRLLGELARPESGKLEGEASSQWRIPTLWELFVFLAGAASAWACLGWILKGWRRLAPHLSALFFRADPRGRLAMRASLDRLADLKLLRLPGETRESFSVRMAEVAPSLEELTRRHLAATLGSADVDVARCLELSRQIREQLRHGRRWPQLAGLLSPWNWIRTS